MPELPISTRRVDKVTYDSLNDTVDFSESSDDRAGRAVVKYGYAQRINFQPGA